VYIRPNSLRTYCDGNRIQQFEHFRLICSALSFFFLPAAVWTMAKLRMSVCEHLVPMWASHFRKIFFCVFSSHSTNSSVAHVFKKRSLYFAALFIYFYHIFFILFLIYFFLLSFLFLTALPSCFIYLPLIAVRLFCYWGLCSCSNRPTVSIFIPNSQKTSCHREDGCLLCCSAL
jgi:hypothetical protein